MTRSLDQEIVLFKSRVVYMTMSGLLNGDLGDYPLEPPTRGKLSIPLPKEQYWRPIPYSLAVHNSIQQNLPARVSSNFRISTLG